MTNNLFKRPETIKEVSERHLIGESFDFTAEISWITFIRIRNFSA
jgi:hypothetical protein